MCCVPVQAPHSCLRDHASTEMLSCRACPCSCAPMAYVLWKETMKINPKNPYFFNRDRFVLSAGHGSMLQYSLLYLAGFDSVGVRLFLHQPRLIVDRPSKPLQADSGWFSGISLARA